MSEVPLHAPVRTAPLALPLPIKTIVPESDPPLPCKMSVNFGRANSCLEKPDSLLLGREARPPPQQQQLSSCTQSPEATLAHPLLLKLTEVPCLL